MDELAHTVNMDPLQFRLKNTADQRLRAVFEAVAEKAAWGKQTATAKRGIGIAGGMRRAATLLPSPKSRSMPQTKCTSSAWSKPSSAGRW